jgi:hypothetical protein
MTGRLKGATSSLTINGVRIDRIIECSVPLEPIRDFLPSLTAEKRSPATAIGCSHGRSTDRIR